MNLATPEIRSAVWKKVGDKRKPSRRPRKTKLKMREEVSTASTPFICCSGQIITTPRCPICGKGENGRNAKIENRRSTTLRLYDDDFELMKTLAAKTGSKTFYEALEKLIPIVDGLTIADIPTPTRKPMRASVSHALNNAIVAKVVELNSRIPDEARSVTAQASFVRVLIAAAKKLVNSTRC
jgi:hypothetical protein